MCGRFTFYSPDEKLEKRFQAKILEPLFRHYNAAPAQKLPVITNDKPDYIRLGLWGLVPAWMAKKKDAKVTGFINARSESVSLKPAFRNAFKKHRCLVIADSFFEWNKETKQPYRLLLSDEKPFAFGGIWEYFKTKDGMLIPSFSIITTPANDLIRPIHLRMPLILKREDEKLWLDNQIKDLSLFKLLRPFPADQMSAFPVSSLVNSFNNDVPEVIEPLKTSV